MYSAVNVIFVKLFLCVLYVLFSSKQHKLHVIVLILNGSGKSLFHCMVLKHEAMNSLL